MLCRESVRGAVGSNVVEYGRVIEVTGNTIAVETIAGASCEGCAAVSSCALASGTSKRCIRMENTLGARVGDEVGFVITEKAVVAGSLLFYLLPAALLVAGALAGAALFQRTGLDRELSSLLGGLAGLIMSFLIIAAISALVKKNRGFSPRLVEVTGRTR
jgi:sigma-E factor negative regulatory protein RseC